MVISDQGMNVHWRALGILFFLVWLLIVWTAAPVQAADPAWWPIQVKSYYGKYDASKKKPGQASQSLKGPRLEEWRPPAHAKRAYNIGVSFPHLKDSYWAAVNYGIIEEANRLGVGIRLVEAGGYDNLDIQLSQMRELVKSGVDGVIVGAISYTGNDEVIEEISKHAKPVVEVINDVHAPHVAAKAMVSFKDMGYFAGEFVAEDAERAGKSKVRVVFLPGPKASGWAPETLEGFKAALADFPGKVEILDVHWGDTGKSVQRELIREMLGEFDNIDYLVGNAVAAEVAPAILEEKGLSDSVFVVSTYIIPSLYDEIAKGRVAAAPSDLTVYQGRMAVDMMVRILNGEKPGKDFAFRSGPFIPMVTPENIGIYPYEGLFGPRDYTPIFNLKPRR